MIDFCVVKLFSDWMHGPMSNVNPDEVENEVGNFWRNLYKLEKQFDSVPAAKKIASKVCNLGYIIEQFLLFFESIRSKL